ncbi:MAG: IS110 family transposase [Candidatus Omnitrophota bacterium]
MKSVAYAGNDVHQGSVVISIYEKEGREPILEKTLINDKAKVQKYYRKLSRTYEVKACYEASGSGYVFHRWLKEIGVECEVIAPSLIPERKGDRIKTDKRDARKLGRLHRAGELVSVHVPEEKDEAMRSFVRLREQISKEVQISKQYILKFLQIRGVVYREGTNWSKKHRQFLKKQNFTDKYDEKVYGKYLLLLEFKEAELKEIDEEIYEIAHGEEYRERVQKMTALRGVRELTAMGVITETIDFKRFGKAREYMSYLGLVPSENSSGGIERRGRITRAGNKRIRRLLIESAWHSRHRVGLGEEFQKRIVNQTDEVKQIAIKAQKRLHNKYWKMIEKGKCKQKTCAAVARELAGFIWALMRTV